MGEENCSRRASASAEAHSDKDNDGRSSQAQYPVSLPCSGIAPTTHILLHKEGTYAPHEKKCRPAHEDDSIVGHHCRRANLSLQQLTMMRYYETGGSIVAPSCL